MKHLLLSFFHQIKKFNLFFIFCLIALQSIGLLTLYSASFENSAFFKQQIIWVSLSWVVFIIISQINVSFIAKFLWPLFWLNLIALIAVYFFGTEVYNARRWLDLGFFNYQPSETFKFILILLTAKKISQRNFGQALSFIELFPFFVFVLPPLCLIILQPDLGTAGVTLIVITTLLLFNGVEKKTLAVFVALFVVSTPLIWSYVLKPYQKSRITSFIKPGKDPQGTGYNVIQSKIAIGSGQVFGKGFKKGTQNKLQFLPERHTDFIFSVLSEEYGFAGSALTLILFFAMIFFIFNLASRQRTRISCCFCLAVGSFLFWHIVLNLSMTMGLFPVVGMPLPLLSYGGSHTLTTMAFLGVVGAIYKQKDLF